MINLLDQLQSNKKCQVCGKNKPIAAFLIAMDKKNQPIYSQICNQCRTLQEAEDDEGGGGKQSGLNIDQKTRQALLDQQKAEREQFEAEKEKYVEKIDQHENKDKEGKAEESKRIHDQKEVLDFLNNEKLAKAFLDKSKDWKSVQDQYPIEYGFIPDLHDPFRQIPVDQHQHIFLSHPDRMDVKFLLEYILSGNYAQHYSNLIGPSSYNQNNPHSNVIQQTTFNFTAAAYGAAATALPVTLLLRGLPISTAFFNPSVLQALSVSALAQNFQAAPNITSPTNSTSLTNLFNKTLNPNNQLDSQTTSLAVTAFQHFKQQIAAKDMGNIQEKTERIINFIKKTWG
ncbi:MAG: hypothetical protein A3E87_02305 [Gammaproteobacteria bacterium RIFCSPHIGHO2_12_FULL_35_23]|nr:MAG: hypothetical protein A3E87_02305 [Gammaproteobacteria bacterium RIFCSPHIGHO2_12_FULL_35_23]